MARAAAKPAKSGTPKKAKAPKLPSLLDRKIYKTGQTRGADDDVIFQNRVGRNSTALIPFSWLKRGISPVKEAFEQGVIVLVSPSDYFALGATKAARTAALAGHGLALGRSALVFYQRRADWEQYNPEKFGWNAATSRTGDLGGQYAARIASTTSDQAARINEGYTSGKMKGAGIRVYEYAPQHTIEQCRIQLEALYWLSVGSIEAAVANGMSEQDATKRKEIVIAEATARGLLDLGRLRNARTIDANGVTVCPLCLMTLDAAGYFTKMAQAEGREVHDLTVTTINLFHINELRVGYFNHEPYNLGWGHHHCNIVVKDAGIQPTLDWMRQVIQRNNA